ncbi:putative membrane protein YphA (DoxX/SURF4 family) [Chryseobacterium rhizosphaerae]|uniref:Membrane protein YphA (DoxX/SURF4 family) n=1 Tax=Chryseobacterium rhizosphaerae TaxID=395937 RepID=A0AAE4C460_9FLAO|nr:hypothetical protein [Chryseobacterium rhizosphaerae]MDR6527224.1 putative membrane protein YphA (DoxX/SURF4 family) [Chryseobacterium rhizosphaerae]
MMNKLKELPFTSYHPSYEFLAFYRIFFSMFLLWIGVSDNSWIHSIPNSAMHPPISILSFIDFIPSETFFVLCRYIMYLGLLLIIIGYKPRIFAIVYMVIYVLTSNYAYSFGKVNHDFVYTLPILIMAFSPWNRTYSFFPEPVKETDGPAKSWPLFMISLIFSFGMFTAGFSKILGGWLSMDTQYTQIFFSQYRYIIGWNDFLSDFYDGINSKIFWEFLDYFTVFFETVFIIAFLYPKFFRFMLLVTVFFHLNVLLMLNISFMYSIGLYTLFIPAYLLPVNFRCKVKKILTHIFNPNYRLIALVMIVLYLLILGFFDINTIGFICNEFFSFIAFGQNSTSLIMMGGAFLLALYLFIRSLRKLDIK